MPDKPVRAPSRLDPSLPPSAKFVATVLRHHEPATQATLADLTHLPKQTVSAAITHLDDAGHLDTVHAGDARGPAYRLIVE